MFGSLAMILNYSAGHLLCLTKGEKTVKKRKVQVIETSHGKFVATWTNRQFLLSPNAVPNKDNNGQQTTELVATVKTIPSNATLEAIITAYVHRRIIFNGFHALSPSITVGIRLPDDHPIFDLLIYRDLEGLKGLLDQGQASLRSYDERGISLLHVMSLKARTVRSQYAHSYSTRPG